MRVKKSVLTVLAAIMLLPGCGENALNLFGTEEDVRLGSEFAAQIYEDPAGFPLLDSLKYEGVYARLKTITDKILASSKIRHKADFAWKVHVVHNDTVLNAFCTPGGYIFVYTGLIHFLESEDQLAGVMGHEIAHADLRHSTEQLTKSMGLKLITQLIAGDASVAGDIAGHLLQLGFSRKDETEADLKSVEYLYDTDYDPRGVARFFQRMEKNAVDLSFLSTHPEPDNRVQQILEHWQKLGAKEGREYREEYQALKRMLPGVNSKQEEESPVSEKHFQKKGW